MNSIVGDFSGNLGKISEILGSKAVSGCDLIVFPECAICGYPPQDLLDYPDFVGRSLRVVQQLCKDFPQKNFIVGGISKNEGSGRPLFNSAFFISDGKVKKIYNKRLLPSYDVFDEDRFFEAGRDPAFIEVAGKKISVTICEDIWTEAIETPLRNRYSQNPIADSKDADLIVNLSASPFEVKKISLREKMLSRIASTLKKPIFYTNAVGANDSLIFEGRSYAVNSSGEIVARGKRFAEDLLRVDTERMLKVSTSESISEVSEIYDALCLGIRDYCQKTGFKSVVLGLSGGIDSSLVACLAADALGAENVVGVLLPSRYTSAESNQDALALARALQNPIHLLPIEFVFSSSLQTLGKAFEGLESDITEENLQSRIRGNLLMALSNKFKHLLLTTGNKSEIAVGYCTLYGDTNGALAPLADIYKTQVYELSKEANRRQMRIPENVFKKAPTAELRANQKDQDSLPDYKILDEILELILEKFESGEQILKRGYNPHDVEKITRWISQSEFKRFQMPIGLKVSSKAFGIGRRIPIVHRFL